MRSSSRSRLLDVAGCLGSSETVGPQCAATTMPCSTSDGDAYAMKTLQQKAHQGYLQCVPCLFLKDPLLESRSTKRKECRRLEVVQYERRASEMMQSIRARQQFSKNFLLEGMKQLLH